MDHPKNYEDSYKTSAQITRQLNKAAGANIFQMDVKENYQTDGTYRNYFTTEMKQRQNYDIKEGYLKGRFKYEKVTIYSSTVSHEADIFCIYDKSMRYAMFYTFNDIDKNNTLVKIHHLDDGAVKAYDMPTVPRSKAPIIDTTNPEEVKWLVEYLDYRMREPKES